MEVFSIIHQKRINRILFSPNNRLVITASDDHTVQVWDLNSKKRIDNFTFEDSVKDIAITSDSRYLISGDDGGNLTVWDILQGKQIFTSNRAKSAILKVAISPDDQLFAAGNETGDVCVWQLDNLEPKLCFKTGQAVWDVVFSRSNYVFAGSLDGYVYIWDLAHKTEYLRIGNSGQVLSLDLSSDDKFLAISTTADTAQFVLWKKEDILPEACKRLPRQLTIEEWNQYLGDSPFDPYCNSHQISQ